MAGAKSVRNKSQPNFRCCQEGTWISVYLSAAKIFGKMQSFSVPEGHLLRTKSFFYSLIVNVNPH